MFKKIGIYKSAVISIVIINAVVYLLQMILGGTFTESFMLVSEDVLTRPWILLTHMFLHSPANLNHIFFNMFALIMFGPILEERVGWKRFLVLYLGSGLIAGFISSFFYNSALGASAAIMGMLGVLIILMPDLRILFFAIIPMPLWLAGCAWVVMDTFGIFFPSGVGNIAHLIGLACGLLYGLLLKKKKAAIVRKIVSKKSGSEIDEADFEEYLRTGRI